MSDTQRWLTNAQMRSALIVVEDLLGNNGRTAVLHLSGLERYIDQLPPNNDKSEVPRGDINAMFAGIVSMFGDQGARGVLRRWGRAYAVKRAESRYALRLLRLVLRFLPPERSANYVLARLLHHLSLASDDQPPIISQSDDDFFVELGDCVFCQGQSHTRRNCTAVVGLLEGLLRWATGNDYDVSEELPSPSESAPRFKIRKRPIGRR